VLKNLRVLIEDDGRHYRFAKADVLDKGHGVMLWVEPNLLKTSRHSDGRTFSGGVGSGRLAKKP